MGPQSWMQHSRWVSPEWRRGRIPSFDQLATLLLMQPRTQLAFWAGRVLCLLRCSLSCTPSPPWQGCSASVPPPACGDTGIALTQLQHLALGPVKTHDIPTSSLLELVQVPLDGIPSFRSVNCTSQLGVICKCAKCALVPSLSLMKILNNTGPNADP